MGTLIRLENDRDRAAVHVVNAAAFGRSAEADLVDALREHAERVVSMVAEADGRIVGHILFSPVTLSGHPELDITGLAPMAVLPGYQRQGIGSALVTAGLEQCRDAGFGAVAVLGHPEYYPRFRFRPAVQFGIGCEYDVPHEAFMLLELVPDYLRDSSGTIGYHDAFGDEGKKS